MEEIAGWVTIAGRMTGWKAGLVEMDRILGVSIFVLIGITSGLAGPGVVVSFLIAGSAALLTSLSAIRLAPFVLDRPTDARDATRHRLRFWEFAIGWMLTFDLAMGAALGSIGFIAYFTHALVGPVQPGIAIFAAAAIPLLVRVVRHASASREQYAVPLAVFKAVALVIFIAVGIASLGTRGYTYDPFFPRGLIGVFEGASINFFAFAALGTLVLATGGSRESRKTLPIAVLAAVIGSILLYCGSSLVALGLIPWPVFQGTEAPLLAAARIETSNPLPVVVIVLAALAATSAVVGTAIAEGERVVPRLTGARNLRALSYSATAIAVAVSLLVIASGGNARLLATLFNFGTLMTYIVINASVIVLLLRPAGEREIPTPFNHPAIPALGIVICISLAATLARSAILAGSLWFVLGSLVYLAVWTRTTDASRRFI